MVMKGEKRPLRKPPIPLLCVLLLLLGPVLPQRAAAEPLPLLRAAEPENTIRIYATPLFQAAGLSPQGNRHYPLKDRGLNDFVDDGLTLLLNKRLTIYRQNVVRGKSGT